MVKISQWMLLGLCAGSTVHASTVVTVATDGSGDYTAIGPAITYAQANAIPTVSVLAGTYTETIAVSATATVTIIGQTSTATSKKRDSNAWDANKVVVTNGGNAVRPLTINTNTKGLTWRNLNFVNSNSASTSGIVSLVGGKNAFYGCSFVSAGSVGFTGSLASGIIANSYLEATDKLLAKYSSLYIFGSTLTVTNNNGLLMYTLGYIVNSIQYNSTNVLDDCSVIQKSGTTNKNVYMAAANGVGSVALYRSTTLPSFIAGTGVYVDTTTANTLNQYLEYDTSGAGSYAQNTANRVGKVTYVSYSASLSAYDISTFFTTVYPSVSAANNDWIDSDVLSAIKASNALHAKSPPSSTSTTSTTTSSSTSSTDTTSSTTSSTSAASTVSCLPSSMPTTALIVGPSTNSCAQYTSIASAIAALPADSTTQYIYILAGTYNEQPTISRTGSVIIRGETSNAKSSSANKVTITNSNGRASSAGSSSTTATFSQSKYETKLAAFYNINFVNSFSPQLNYVALAVYAKGQKVAFYGCNIDSSQGSLYLDYGSVYFSGGRISGTTDFIWGQGAGYFFNSIIETDGTTTGQTVAAHKYQSSYGYSRFVFDLCAVVPESSSVSKKSTYLGRDYSTAANVAFVNSYMDAHIASAGWLVNSPSTFVGTFVEANNTGPGSDTSSRSSSAQVLSDSSAYSVKNVLGDDSWLDSSAIAPFSGWPDSVYAVTSTATTSSSTSTSATATSTAAESTLTVAPTPTGSQYGSVASAVAALPTDGKDYTIYILAGTYEEQFSITRRGKVTLRGETSYANDFTGNKVLIKFSDGVSTSSNQNEETPVINWKNTNGDGLALYNLNFTNTFPQTNSYASLAADFYGTNMAAYGCAFKGFQDSLLVNQGVQVFSNSYIEGSVDFIWGYSKAYFHQCYVASNTPNAYITAQNRPNAAWAGGFVFDNSLITYTSSYGSTYSSTSLGRPWSQYAIVVYMNSYLDKHISAAGWSTWSSSDARTGNVVFGEFNNTGPGNWTSSRASFATSLTATQASAYSLSSFIGSTSWLDMTAYNLVPSYSWTKASTEPSTTTTDAEWAHPTSGTEPPAGAVLVSVDGSVDGSYSSLTDALASLPSDSSTQIIFMYAGTYNEQVPSISRSGPVMIIGYTESAPGKTYSTNQVIITQARGLSVSPLPTGHSNSETATIATGSTKIAMYNIDIKNTENLDGAISSYVTLAASIYGNKIGFYGCSFIGWQDTLLTGATAGYQYYESCYIDGAIDFIWGYSKAYFKGCTLAAKRKNSAITAQSRTSASAIGGYIFDQCLFTAASTATVDLTEAVYLGRPYSKYAVVVIKNSYLDNTIQPAGWKIWSTSDPRTDAITFAEYNNDGPGNWGNNSAAREAFGYATLLTSDTYGLSSVMDTTDWIDMTYWDTIKTPQPSTVVTTPVTTTYDGTTPPAGAFLVSKTAIDGKTTYSTIQDALNALPASSSVTATVFIYPGTYNEQLILSKSGTTIFLGYSTSHKDYTQNQVTITYDKGIDTQAEASNSDSATVYATGNYFQAVNINFANTFGTTSDYASLGFGVKSSKYAGLYACQVYGNQDALLINGYLFASNSYIEGNIDMIWGSGSGYFLNSTIATNRDGIDITAHKRATSTTAAGFVFDQCTIKAAGSASYSSVSLGRPWSQYARVAYISSYLGSLVKAAGWDQWTKADPRTDGVTFGEMGNTGPGAATESRAAFATQLAASDAVQFEVGTFFTATAWINSTFVYATPFVASAVSAPTASTTSTSTSTTSTTTVYTTTITTLKQTLSTTTTGLEQTTTIKTTTTLDIGTTITPDPTTSTTFVKSTTTIPSTVTEADEVVTTKSTQTVDVGTTITPDPKTETTWSTVEFRTTIVATTSAKPSTVKTTTTETSYTTSTPKATTTTQIISSTIKTTTTTTPKAVTVKSTSTITTGNGGVTTTTAKATTSYVTVYTTSTKTTKKTTTISCIPANSAKKRSFDDLVVPTIAPMVWDGDAEGDAGALLARAAGLETTTVVVTSVYTTVVKTSTISIAGSTVSTDLVITKTTGKVSTLKPVTATITSVSQFTKYTTTTVPGATSTVTQLTTKTTGKTTTLKASTVVLTSVTSETETVKSTTTLPASTTTSVATATRVITSVLDQSTATITSSKLTTSVETSTLPASTTTIWDTVKTTLKPSSTETVQSTVVKTTTIKVGTTTTVWATKTSKSAKACPTDE
ncbi:pectin lyase fold/virulence factor [Dactylonectria macrodidyma]|uniref:pectinesterase n=1 Tax=Dactylonectria macrodidyma TaxID=307937 RepID=A0A9P9EY60_9HYPO|nr:pectin lyase fold/virulence factor [Dactylonectria macrodidyma]